MKNDDMPGRTVRLRQRPPLGVFKVVKIVEMCGRCGFVIDNGRQRFEALRKEIVIASARDARTML